MRRSKWGLGLILGAALSLESMGEGCTGIKLAAKDGSVVNGRTLEFGIPVKADVVVVPRGYSFVGSTPEGEGLKYEAKYGCVGAFAFDYPAIMDGLNEKGLSVGTFYFPGFAEYTPLTKENQSKALSPIDFSNWLLTQFASVDEVKEALNKVVIVPTVMKSWGNAPAPFHYIVYDKSGKSLVIEPIKGKLVTYDNPLGVFTNSPSFDWHMTNLSNYIHLSPDNAPPQTIEGVKFTSFGQGSGLVGLPGDFTPPSRFVRATLFSASALPSKDSKEAVFQAFHILNQFDIPLGAIRSQENGKSGSDFTQVTSVKDPEALAYYFKTYDDQTLRKADLKKFDLKGKALKKFSVVGTQAAVDISSEFK